ncbi:MAG: TRAP transporter small permease [Deltaproteobacteria bacterium HGW-Deltaproteobacteria-12]|jgi:TRAP-type C4-dicarboxylate transport system permease small subunit|nr:MAG: TRAP transporter small permease [Deltaproteobacteria bacterium HGW-Deltaproteobacteria-12]
MKRLINTIDTLSGIGGWLAAGFMSIALLMALAEIATRSFLGRTLYIADEYAGYLMALMTLIGLAYTLRERGHIRMMFLVHMLKGRAKTIYSMICLVVGFLFCIAFVWFTWDFFWDSVVNKTQSMQLSETYLAIPQAVLPLGGILLALQFLAEFLKGVAVLRKKTEGLRIQEEADELGR